jgi:predicted nucleic acid-binding Zn ribbon protein
VVRDGREQKEHPLLDTGNNYIKDKNGHNKLDDYCGAFTSSGSFLNAQCTRELDFILAEPFPVRHFGGGDWVQVSGWVVIYDYGCLSCGKPFQLDRPMASPIKNGRHHKARCPHCRSLKVKKKLHIAEIRYVGSGFYKTDNK